MNLTVKCWGESHWNFSLVLDTSVQWRLKVRVSKCLFLNTVILSHGQFCALHPQKILAMSGGIFHSQVKGGSVCSGILWVGAKEDTKHPTVDRTALPQTMKWSQMSILRMRNSTGAESVQGRCFKIFPRKHTLKIPLCTWAEIFVFKVT